MSLLKGCELLGANTPEADAEVVIMAIESILATCLENFKIDITRSDF